MKTFKRIPLPDHEYIFIVQWSDVTSFKLKRHYSKISGTVHWTVDASLDALQVINEYEPGLWYDLEVGNVVQELTRHGFTETEATELEFKMYN